MLWFESDLFDQLQLMQVLDALPASREVALVLVDEHPFRGVSELGPAELRAAFERRRPVGDEQRRWARAAWTAFRSRDPGELPDFAFAEDAPVPAIAVALRRHLQQFPATGNGLSRTERALLDGAAAGPRTRAELFGHQQAREEQPFMGDTWAWRYLDDLAEAGLVEHEGELLAATPLGTDVLAGRADRLAEAPIDRWLGGVHLTGARVWRWDDGGQGAARRLKLSARAPRRRTAACARAADRPEQRLPRRTRFDDERIIHKDDNVGASPANPISCVTTTIVMPPLARSSITSRTSPTISGSSTLSLRRTASPSAPSPEHAGSQRAAAGPQRNGEGTHWAFRGGRPSRAASWPLRDRRPRDFDRPHRASAPRHVI